jgi:hypothetical protein
MEKARLDSERQQVYVESFVQPILPQSPNPSATLEHVPRHARRIHGMVLAELRANGLKG